MTSGFRRVLALLVRRGASVVGRLAGANAAVRARVTARAPAASRHGIIQVRVDAVRAAGHAGGSVGEGEGQAAALDHEGPAEPAPQVSVLQIV